MRSPLRLLFALTLALVCFLSPAAFAVGLTNGANHTGFLSGETDIDAWTIHVNAGERVRIRVAGDLAIRSEFYRPDGTQVGLNNGYSDAAFDYTATSTGTHTVLLTPYYDDDSGAYIVRPMIVPQPFVVPAGDDGGALTNGANQAGVLVVGDIDAWTIHVTAGQQVRIRVTGNFAIRSELYRPDGTEVGPINQGYNDGIIGYTATSTGTHTVMMTPYHREDSGAYTVRPMIVPQPFVVPEGDDGGALTNGANQTGALVAGDIDAWTIFATAGERVRLRVSGSLSIVSELHQPDGTRVGLINGEPDGMIDYLATSTGTHTLVMTSRHRQDSGSYTVRPIIVPQPFVVPVGDEGGALTNGSSQPGTLVFGDIDAWTIHVTAGQRVQIRVTGTLAIQSALHRPDGTQAGLLNGYSDATFDYVATSTGTHTVVLTSYHSGASGTYTIFPANLSDPYLFWLHTHFPSAFGNPASEATIWGPSADSDADGAPNWFEYHFGFSPTVGQSSLPLKVTVEGGFLVGEFRRRAGASDVAIVVQWSNDLTGWSAIGVTYDLPVADGVFEIVRARVPLSGASRKFLRAQVSRPD